MVILFENDSEFRWVGEGTLPKKKSEIHYKAFYLDDLKFEIGDFVLIRNDESVDPEDPSHCYVGQIKDLYDNGDKYEPHVARVQWFSRVTELPPFAQKLFNELFENELVQENRPHYSDIIDADTIFNKCVVKFLSVTEDCRSFETSEGNNEIPTFFCRYRFAGTKLLPNIDTQDSSLQSNKNTSSNKKKTRIHSALKKGQYYAVPTGTPEFPKVIIKKLDDRLLENPDVRIIVAEPHAKTIDDVADTLRKTLAFDKQKEDSGKRPIIHSFDFPKQDQSEKRKESSSLSTDTPKKNPYAANVSKRILRNTPQRSSALKSTTEDLKLGSSSKTSYTTPRKFKTKSASKSPNLIKTPKRSIKFSEDQETTVTRSGRRVKRVDYFAPQSTEKEYKPTLLGNIQRKNLSKFIKSNYSEDSDSGSAYSANKSSSSDEDSESDCSTERKNSHSSRKHLPNIPKVKRSVKKCLEFSIPERKTPLRKPQNILEESRLRLHAAAVPKSLPCREEEYCDIYSFVRDCLCLQTGGCMYISGVPGTGKTATVNEVIRNLEEEKKNGDIPCFTFVEVNGMWMTDPYKCYVHIFKSLTGKTIASQQACNLLEKRFTEPGPKKDAVVLLVDELDRLWTRKQTVMYNIFDWPTKKNSKLIVLAIANTMDLPERLMMNRVASRLGLSRLTFQPYNFKQLQEIILNRIQELKVFDPDAVQFVARKVAAISGDARRALAICRYATEIVERTCLSPSKKQKVLIGMEHVDEAIQQMFSSPVIAFIKSSSKIAKLFLQGILNEFTRTGSEETTLNKVSTHVVTVCKFEGLKPPSASEISSVCAKLAASHVILSDNFQNGIHMKLRLGVDPDDVNYALTGKGLSR
ncbi:origin recognition complex subunit 1 [Trichonephila clavata]|uniref:Origin recognition complex subunit 1 n=1 Tax=Trichonephila clavata TaxID=2740835 RepID=A0A8X6FLN7_TRICU|nr:origin recognition complex subunit 1 [Trichonephila clavata]